MIWFLFAWCGVALGLALAVGRLLRSPRRDHECEAYRDLAVVRTMPLTHGLRSQHDAPPDDRIPPTRYMLAELDRLDPRLARTLLLRWIGGLSRPAIAAAMGVDVTIVEHDLKQARLLLRHKFAMAAPLPSRD